MYTEAGFVLDTSSSYLGEREAAGSAPKFNCDGGNSALHTVDKSMTHTLSLESLLADRTGGTQQLSPTIMEECSICAAIGSSAAVAPTAVED